MHLSSDKLESDMVFKDICNLYFFMKKRKMIKGNIGLCGKISHAITTVSNGKNEVYTHLLVKLYLSDKVGRVKEFMRR